MAAFFIGFCLDQIIGDPWNIPHPIRLIGNLISFLDKTLLGKTEDNKRNNRNNRREFVRGVFLCIIVTVLTVAVTLGLMLGAYAIHP